ncbi:MAG: hypothetical protein QM728_00035 [Gordonia sp. (in: high G+C Gram-positive bacteria)]|uniref:hypothetical protein n=1 Tax=Gordonia sp. (in: high G+C Gram-positive bacteria) TaxID=84139 RepID=UPI0039E5BE9F
MLTAEQVAAWPDRPMTDAAREARSSSNALRNGIVDSRESLRRASTWRGSARDWATRRFDEEVDHVTEVARAISAFADAVEAAGAELADGRAAVLRLSDEAAMAADKVPEFSRDEVFAQIPTADQDRAVVEADERLRKALADLDAADRRRAAELKVLVAELDAMVDGHVDVTTPEGPRDPDQVVTRLVAMTPVGRREFLARMSPRDIDRLVIANPQAMGNLDGVPFPVRIAANRRGIEEALDGEIRRGAGDRPRARQLREMLGSVADPGNPRRQVSRQFISFANTPAGRSVEMYGSLGPGTRSAAVYVPGTGTRMDTAAANRTAAWNFANRSGSPVFLYMDGVLPPDLPSALSPRFAETLAPRLVEFGRSLDVEVAARAPGAATVYLGHSYGGAVVGTAEQLGLRADRVIYASASGTGVLPGGSDAWSNPAEPHRFSVTPPGDPIHPFQATGAHGGDPDTTPGVTRIDSGDYHDGQRVRGAHGHGAYFDDPDSGAFRNMVAVIRGEEPAAYVRREPDVSGRR